MSATRAGRRMGITKRRPRLPAEVLAIYEKLSKADWAEIAVDVMRGGTGFDETVSGADLAAEVIARKAILRPKVKP